MTRMLMISSLALALTSGRTVLADCGAPHASAMPGTATALATAAADSRPAAMDIVDTAVAAGELTTLVSAVQAAELVDVLRGAGPFTVFAPSDAAFAKLPEAAIAGLLADREALTSVLTHHVVSGRVLAADLAARAEAALELPTVQGGTLLVRLEEDGTVMIDGAKVISADIMATNGVIHVIDAVVQPGATL